MSARLVQELAADGVPVAATCRVLGISRSGLYDALNRTPSARAVADQALTATITAIHHGSRGTYGAPRVRAELRLGLGIACGRKRGREADARRRVGRGLSPAQTPRAAAAAGTARGSRPAAVHRRQPGPVVVHRHH